MNVRRALHLGRMAFLLGILFFKTQSTLANPAELYATVQKSPPRITVNWINPGGITGYTIYRSTTIGGNTNGSGNWGSAIATLPGNATSFIDTNVAINFGYEYRVKANGVADGDGYIFTGIELPLVESRGKLVLVVDDLFTQPLAFELDQLQKDLIGDGWTVLRHDVSRNDTAANIKNIIKSDYLADPTNVTAVFLLGHIPIAYSGWVDPDDHGPRPAPTDTFYGDMTGVWTDNINYGDNSPSNHSWWVNLPGDGKYDQNTIPGRMDLQVGRVDFFEMTDFQPYGLYETDLLRRYLKKDHDFRTGVFTVTNRGADMNSGQGDYFQTQCFGTGNTTTVNDYFGTFENNSYLWLSKGGGGGAYDFSADIGYTADLAASSGIKVVFNSWFASSYWEWDVENAFLRAPLAANGYGLVSFWSENPCYVLHHLALGKNIGYSTRLTQNNSDYYAHHGYLTFALYRRGVHMSLLGDPSLRMHVVAPPSNLTTSSSSGQIVLNWNTSPQSGLLGYNVYRANSQQGSFVRLNDTFVTGTTFTDTNPPAGSSVYMVRAIKVETSGSGSYINASQGIFDEQGPKVLLADDVTATKVKVVFDRALNSSSAQNAGNYSINNGITVNSASLQSDGHTVILGTSAQTDGINYILTINNVAAQSNASKTIIPNTQVNYLYSEIPEYGSDTNTVALWHLNGNGTDASGNGNTLSYGSGVTFAEFSPIGSNRLALHTTNTDSGGNIAAKASIPDSLIMPSARPFTFEARIFINAWTAYGVTGQGNVLTLIHDYDSFFYLAQQGMWDQPAYGKSIVNGVNLLTPAQFKAVAPTGKWLQLALVFDGTNKNYVYIDGRQVAGPVTSTPNVGRTGAWTISLGNFDGYIDEVRLSKMARTFLTPPAALSANAASDSQINLSWINKANNAAGFEIQRWSANGSSASIIATTIATNIVTYSDTNLTAGTKYYYRIRAYQGTTKSDFSGEASALTSAATAILPAITNQPQSQTVNQGDNVTFVVQATGTAPFSYQWKIDGSNLPGATTSTLNLVNIQPTNAGNYSVVVSNVAGSVLSSNAFLAVNVPPSITAQPQDQMAIQGSNVTFTVTASGTAPLSYQWQYNSTTISGATDSVYTLSSVQPNQEGGYSVLVENNVGSVTSAVASLTVIIPPSIAIQPQGIAVAAGSDVQFSTVAAGTPPLAYQWLFNGNPIPGSTDTNCFRTNVQSADAGSYSVVVTNFGGGVTSSIAQLTVNNRPLLSPIANQVIPEETTLLITNEVIDPDSPSTLTFSLDTNAPSGASINLTNGLFSWTPSEAQGPGSNVITVTVTDNGTPSLSDSRIFTVVVLEVNQAPVLAGVSNRTVHVGSFVSFVTSATDTDLPANLLTFSLDSGGPANANINPTNGVFSWSPSETDVGTNQITIRVTDDGEFNLSDTETVSVVVLSRPVIQSIDLSDDTVVLSWSAIEGQTYRVEYKENLADVEWTALPGDVISSGATASKSISPNSSGQRFYRIAVLH